MKDDSIACIPYNLTSHIMCGNHGTITFESPEYAVREDGKQIRLTIQRSGGGVGEVAVSYSIYPITAGYEDVTSTAYYTANQTVVFRPGQIRASFQVTINDDRLLVSSSARGCLGSGRRLTFCPFTAGSKRDLFGSFVKSYWRWTTWDSTSNDCNYY